MNIKSDIEEQLRQEIIGAAISRYRLAKLSGVSEGVISNFVNRRRTMTMVTGARCAAILGLELRPVKKPAKAKVKYGKSD
jgi:plasmid maintenance system antidote protein VapI